jgi:hypothetical protein
MSLTRSYFNEIHPFFKTVHFGVLARPSLVVGPAVWKATSGLLKARCCQPTTRPLIACMSDDLGADDVMTSFTLWASDCRFHLLPFLLCLCSW